MPRDTVAAQCPNCRIPCYITRTLWRRVLGHIACGHCRKTTHWEEL